MSRKKYFWIGGIIGGIIALLYAPKNGKETREDLLNVTKEVVNDPQHIKAKIKSKLNKIIDRLKTDDIVEQEIIISREFDE